LVCGGIYGGALRGWVYVVDLILYLMAGVLIGSRLGYIAVYNAAFYVMHPLAIVWPFDEVMGAWIGISGMSYHGGLIGIVIALWIFMYHYHVSFWKLADALAFAVPLGYVFGRIGNFLNGELYGRVTEKMWGMYFPQAQLGDVILRHPSQLYEAFFEGLILYFLLVWMRRYKYISGQVAAVYIIGYNIFRLLLECFREPDKQIGFVFTNVTLGQIISSIFLFIGIGLFFWLQRKKYGTIKT
jgi:phosphatidylglycerol:prolipoprotein diacylglycerol transferase